MKQFLAAADDLHTWFDTHFDHRGVFVLDPDSPRAHFKAPFVLAYMGLHTKGARVAKYINERFLDTNGDLIPTPNWGIGSCIYAMGWLTLGALSVRRFDIAQLV